MKYPALSFWQPYAWLIVNGHASVDSRMGYPPQKYLGQRIVIHASKKKITRAGFAEFLVMMRNLKIKKHPRGPEDFDYGAIVRTVRIQAVAQSSRSYFANPGYYHWDLSSPRKIKPIAQRGMRGWFSVEI